MCGRYVAATPVDVLVEHFGVTEVRLDADLPPSWNVAPTREVYAVAQRREDNERTIGALRWGLVPSWAPDPSVGARLINARLETLDAKPAFRRALVARRCLIPADGFYEWERRADGSKQPYLVSRADGGVLAFAGLWEVWKDASGQWLRSCAIVTTDATGALGAIHERCPVLVAPDRWEPWLDRTRHDSAAALALLEPAPPDLLVMHPVSRDVNDVRNDRPDLVAAVEPEPEGESEPTLF
ncbi:MAG TPA: SOS response-associated peptidase [Acidimicrobiales bacterium]|nr:SOS response-associated peptidase [Acidimicrobiales bacterium]